MGDQSASSKFEVQAYKRPSKVEDLIDSHVPFTGSPQRHPYVDHKVILIPDPYSTDRFYYEFRARDINYAEELPSLVDISGNTVPMVRIWVRKRSVALRCAPFVVEDTRHRSG
jgi:inorganic pyrophosphatase